MIQVTITCDTGKTWETSFNGDHEAAVRYFLGQVFTDEDDATGTETRHRIVRVESNPARANDIHALLRKAERGLATLRQQYQEGETMDIREKYLDEIRDEIEKAAYVVSFLKGNL